MSRHEHPQRRRHDRPAGERRSPEPAAELPILDLQRAAGNRAVSALLARQPAPADSRERPKDAARGTSSTLGLGDDIGVIPLDSAAWGESRGGEVHELHVSFPNNAAAARIQQAAVRGTPIAEGFYSTAGGTARMTSILISSFSMADGSGGEPIVSLTLNFASMKFEPVR